MKLEYDFESHTPPNFTSADLKRAALKRRAKKQVMLLRLLSCFNIILLLRFSIIALRFSALLSLAALIAAAWSLIGGTVIAVLFRRGQHNLKEGEHL